MKNNKDTHNIQQNDSNFSLFTIPMEAGAQDVPFLTTSTNFESPTALETQPAATSSNNKRSYSSITDEKQLYQDSINPIPSNSLLPGAAVQDTESINSNSGHRRASSYGSAFGTDFIEPAMLGISMDNMLYGPVDNKSKTRKASSPCPGLGPPRHVPAQAPGQLSSFRTNGNGHSRNGTTSGGSMYSGLSSANSLLSGLSSGSTSNSSTSSSGELDNITLVASHSNSQISQPRRQSVRSSTGTTNTTNDPKVRKRKKHRKSHLGCMNCKQRRIKCDESLPECSQCIKYRVDCSYLLLSGPEVAELRRQKAAMAAANLNEQELKKEAHKGPTKASVDSASTEGVTIATQPAQQSVTSSKNYTMSNEIKNTLTNSNQDTQNNRTSNLITPKPPTFDDITTADMNNMSMPPFPTEPYSLTPTIMEIFDSPRQVLPQHRDVEKVPFFVSKSDQKRVSPSGAGSSANNLLDNTSTNTLNTPYTIATTNNTPNFMSISISRDSDEAANSTAAAKYDTSKRAIWLEGFESAILRTIFEQFIDSVYMLAGSDDILYHAVMSFSFGFLAVRTGNHKLYSHDHRACALRLLQRELIKPKCDNPDSLASAALIMSWDSFFQQDDLRAYVNLSKGVGTVLEKIELSENVTGVAGCMKHALFEAMKCVHVPPYGHDFLPELYGHVQSVRPFIERSMDATLCNQHTALLDYLRYVMNYLQSHTRDVVSVGRYYYSPQFLFDILRQWLQIFPINALSNVNTYSEYHQLTYLYYHTVTRVLDALFPEARYIFQFGFIGPVDSVGMDATFAESLNPGVSAYPLKVMNFFRDRLVRLNTMLADLAPMGLEFPEKSIFELCISSFDTTVLSAQHMPMLTPFVSGSSQTLLHPLSAEGREVDNSSSKGDTNFFHVYFSDRMAILQT